MRFSRMIISFLVLATASLVLVSCGGKAVAIGDLPVYPGAVELKASDSQIATTLAKNTEQDAAMRKALGAGGQTVQKGFSLPAGTEWDAVSAFYEKELKARGWQSGLGGMAGGIDVNSMMNMATQGANAPKTMIFSKGKQTLTLIQTLDPTKPSAKTLILSLSTR